MDVGQDLLLELFLFLLKLNTFLLLWILENSCSCTLFRRLGFSNFQCKSFISWCRYLCFSCRYHCTTRLLGFNCSFLGFYFILESWSNKRCTTWLWLFLLCSRIMKRWGCHFLSFIRHLRKKGKGKGSEAANFELSSLGLQSHKYIIAQMKIPAFKLDSEVNSTNLHELYTPLKESLQTTLSLFQLLSRSQLWDSRLLLLTGELLKKIGPTWQQLGGGGGGQRPWDSCLDFNQWTSPSRILSWQLVFLQNSEEFYAYETPLAKQKQKNIYFGAPWSSFMFLIHNCHIISSKEIVLNESKSRRIVIFPISSKEMIQKQ